MTVKSTEFAKKTGTEQVQVKNSNNISRQEPSTYTISCACCNNDIKGKSISIFYYGSLIQLCGEPCGIRDYLGTQ